MPPTSPFPTLKYRTKKNATSLPPRTSQPSASSTPTKRQPSGRHYITPSSSKKAEAPLTNREQTPSSKKSKTSPVKTEQTSSPRKVDACSSKSEQTSIFNRVKAFPFQPEHTFLLKDSETHPVKRRKMGSPVVDSTVDEFSENEATDNNHGAYRNIGFYLKDPRVPVKAFIRGGLLHFKLHRSHADIELRLQGPTAFVQRHDVFLHGALEDIQNESLLRQVIMHLVEGQHKRNLVISVKDVHPNDSEDSPEAKQEEEHPSEYEDDQYFGYDNKGIFEGEDDDMESADE